MDAWMQVGSDILWVIRWPILAALWALFGVMADSQDDKWFYFFIAGIGWTVAVANGLGARW